jgi:hypothetical protein
MIQFDKNRKRVKQCPFGKSNKDGKFIPYVGHDNKVLHACGKPFLPEVSANGTHQLLSTGVAAQTIILLTAGQTNIHPSSVLTFFSFSEGL